jgi:hypothetical protein
MRGRSTSRFAGRAVAGFALGIIVTTASAQADPLEIVPVDGQPIAANVERLTRALELLGAPLPADAAAGLATAARSRDSEAIQRLLDPRVLMTVTINPEERVKVGRGPAEARLQQGGYIPVLVKVVNEAATTRALRITSPQSGLVSAGASKLSASRLDQKEHREGEVAGGAPGRFLQAELFTGQPMTANLSGLRVEYALALLYSSEAGKREATIGFDIGQGTQDLGFRGEVPILFDVRPAVPVTVRIRDHDGQPTVAHFTFVDRAGRILPPQPKRTAPDLAFQRQIYRADGGHVLLPPGTIRVTFGRGPEYRVKTQELVVGERFAPTLDVQLERWIDPAAHGYFSGDHHIHAAGCAHYTDPTQGVEPKDMFLQVKGEGLNVGCVLTWGPCYDVQRRFFLPRPDGLSEPLTAIKYDVEVSGFGSQALGHVCLLNLRDQSYPGSDGTATKGWPSWTTPVLRWAKAQGAVTGYAHSASGLEIDSKAATGRLLKALDKNADDSLTRSEADAGLLPGDFASADADRDGALTRAELETAHERAAETLPNYAIPEMDGVGAMEIVVSVPQGVCDFVSAMDTPRTAEWNCWYHLLNCGFPLKVSGETDFPCMSGMRVGQGRVYVRLGAATSIDFNAWCAGLAAGRSYVSDGFAHPLEFEVGGTRPGERLQLKEPSPVSVHARVAFAARMPRTVAQGRVVPAGGPRLLGDTVNLHGPRRDDELTPPGEFHRVELIVNGKTVAHRDVPADDSLHDLEFRVPIERSSWVALRQFPQFHTNPVDVIVAGRPIRASRRSALWCMGVVEQLWDTRGRTIAAAERDEARRAFDQALASYRRIASEADDDR